PYTVKSTASGKVISTLNTGAQVSRDSLLARISRGDEVATVRSPLLGVADRILVTNGATISAGDPIVTIKSDETSVWESLRGLALIGTNEDLPVIEAYQNGA